MTTRQTAPRRMAIDGNSYPACDACGQHQIAPLTPLPWTDEHGMPQTAHVCASCTPPADTDAATDVGLVQGTARRHF